MENRTIKIALAGNPNSGKTTLFNAITGAHHKVGNYPGVTVEKFEGTRVRGGRQYHFTDLPGIYSLTAYSIDEVVARDFILDEKPDLIVDVLDSTNLERNLYLALQFQELGLPVVGALNMSDEAAAKGIVIDIATLSATLGIPFVQTVGSKGKGIDALLDVIDNTAAYYRKQAGTGEGAKSVQYGREVEEKLGLIEPLLAEDADFASKYPVRFIAVKLLEKDKEAGALLKQHKNREKIEAEVKKADNWLEGHYGRESAIIISEQRYGYIRGAVKEAVKITGEPASTFTEKIDKVLMNKFLAFPIFLGVLWLIFQVTFTAGAYPAEWLEIFFSFLADVLTNVLGAGFLKDLLVDGILGGVGSVLSFVPYIVLLFLLLSTLEDTGYISRAAFATDKLLHSFGLHGQSIFPLMLGFGCSVPAVMAARTLKSPKDRIITVLVTPFMTCGAKLPVHLLFAAAFFPAHAANMLILIYALGVIFALIAAKVLRATVLKGDPTPFVLELPPFRSPTLSGILWHVWEKTFQYIKKAGTIILACSIVIWALTTFPKAELSGAEQENLAAALQAENPGADEDEINSMLETIGANYALEHSFAGDIGRGINPVFRPLGFNWRLSIASFTGFAAKEVVVSTLGILYSIGTEEDETSTGLRGALANDPDMSPLTAFVFMIFTLIIPPCIAALGTIKAELGWKWLGFEVLFQLLLGWVICFIIFRAGSLI